MVANIDVIGSTHVLINRDDLHFCTKISYLGRQLRCRCFIVDDLDVECFKPGLCLPKQGREFVAPALGRVEILEEGLEPVCGASYVFSCLIQRRLRVNWNDQQQNHGHHSQHEPLAHHARLHGRHCPPGAAWLRTASHDP